jgi:hypothetical protein
MWFIILKPLKLPEKFPAQEILYSFLPSASARNPYPSDILVLLADYHASWSV